MNEILRTPLMKEKYYILLKLNALLNDQKLARVFILQSTVTCNIGNSSVKEEIT